jgi:hypothetical protein
MMRVRVRRVQVRAFATGAAPKAPAGKAEVTVGFMSRRARARDGSFARSRRARAWVRVGCGGVLTGGVLDSRRA